ncbi:hypothetical protein DAPPUDRAFT_256303 [Daphnia pulex]|uniref:C2H2-type domain-containing protein n=1 Tax=Daphnia pulex TaxID=6669 RepID=E9HB25_DAPPU|nr:hypothetical protein DAPPUDRAFT_256303 [Daphnia pulex]|eukprot:EFX71040.1 hypothetical protein DAPPUDRAFT_256303 [Daphnia pulex]
MGSFTQQAQPSSELSEVSIDAEALENSTTLPPMSETQTESHWDLESELLTAPTEDSKREETKCLSCEREFKRASHLKTHMRSNCGANKSHVCPICTKSFATAQALTAHDKSHADPDSEPMHCMCDSCGLKFLSFQLYLRHTEEGCTQTNGRDKPFKCPECNLFFRTTGHRQSHLKSHRKAAQAVGKPGEIRTVSSAANKRKLKAKSNTQRVSSHDIDYEAHLAKVIAISGDLSNQHNSLGDQSGSLGNCEIPLRRSRQCPIANIGLDYVAGLEGLN